MNNDLLELHSLATKKGLLTGQERLRLCELRDTLNPSLVTSQEDLNKACDMLGIKRLLLDAAIRN